MAPKYQRIAEDLRRRIEGGDYPPGSKLPTMDETAAAEGVARGTVERAYNLLADTGYVEIKQKGGTVVLDRSPVRLKVSRYSLVNQPGGNGGRGPWGTACAAQGFEGTMNVLGVDHEPLPRAVADQFDVPPGTMGVRRDRIALLNGKPAQIQTAWYLQEMVEGSPLAEPGKIRGGVYGVLVELGLTPDPRPQETVMAREPTPEEASILNLRGGSWVLEVNRLTRTSDGTRVEVLTTIADPRRNVFVFD